MLRSCLAQVECEPLSPTVLAQLTVRGTRLPSKLTVRAKRYKVVVLQTRLDRFLAKNKRRGHKVRYKEMAGQWLSPQLLGVSLKGAEYRGHSHHTGTRCSETFLNLLSLVPAHAGIFYFETVSHIARTGLELIL